VSEAGRLAGCRVLVPRPRERAEALCFLLEDEGAEVVALPVLELLPPTDPRPLRAAAEMVHRYAWIAFASPAGVDACVEAVREANGLERLSRVKLAAVGPRTAKALASLGLAVALESSGGGGSLAEALLPRLSAGDEVLLPAAEEGRTELAEALDAAGVAVTRVAAYRAERAALDEEALATLAASPPAAVVLASPRTAEALLDAIGSRGAAWFGAAKRVAIGPTTAAALSQLGWPADQVAAAPTPEGLVEATCRAVRG